MLENNVACHSISFSGLIVPPITNEEQYDKCHSNRSSYYENSGQFVTANCTKVTTHCHKSTAIHGSGERNETKAYTVVAEKACIGPKQRQAVKKLSP